MRAQDAYLSQFRTLVEEINRTLAGVPDELLYQRPGPSLNPIGWNHWHLLRIWDMELNQIIKGREPSEDTWYRAGYSEHSGYNPEGKGAGGAGTGMGYTDEEVDEVQIRRAIIRSYQLKLMAETASYLRAADDAELERKVTYWAGETTCAKIIEQAIRNGWMHYGEIRFVKGMLGYPDPTYPGPSQE